MTSTQIFPNQKLTLDPLITKDSSKLSAQKKKEEAELKELLMAPLPETQEERLKRIETLFSSFDANSSGKIDRQSIRDRFSKASDLPSGLTYANELFEVVDSSKDGVIDFQEFKNFVLAKETKLWHLFNRIDQSKDKLLQPNEVLKGLKDAGLEVSKQDLNTFMKKIDKDGDGMIDFEEWRDFLLFLPRDVTLVNVFQYSQAMNLINPIGDMSPVTNVLVSRLRYLVAGGIAGAVSRTATAPLDRLKIYLQTSSSATAYKVAGSGISSWATTIRLAVNDIYSKGGIRNFFRGNGLNIIKIMPESATKFYAFESSKQFILNQKRASNGSHLTSSTLSMSDRFLAGGIAGLCSQTLIYPLEIVKTRLMSTPSAENSKKVGIFNVINKVYQQTGPRGFFRGLVPSLIGVFPYAAIDLSVFETLKLKYLNYTGRPSTANPGVGPILVCGMISGTAGAVAVYPLNLIRTRLQAQDTPSHPYRYTGTFDAIRQTYQRESIKGFYKGLTPTLIKVVPAVSISYVVYEHCKKNMHLS